MERKGNNSAPWVGVGKCPTKWVLHVFGEANIVEVRIPSPEMAVRAEGVETLRDHRAAESSGARPPLRQKRSCEQLHDC